jgi:serine/threonine-protein kinase SRPK3
MRRFERIYDVVEPVEEYRPGGYHPIHLHDMFKDRYEVIAKLAFGQFSTVWLAEDHK